MLRYCFACVALNMALLLPAVCRANPHTELVHRLVGDAHSRWQAAQSQMPTPTGGVRIKASGSAELAAARARARAEYLNELVPAMQPSKAVAHIPNEHAVEVDESQNWTRFYQLAKDRLRPRVEYAWSSNATLEADVITLSEEHLKVLRANFDVLMWYRRELEQIADAQQSDTAAHFKLFLDHIVAGLLEGLPSAPEINLNTGTLSRSTWKLDEKKLREQLVMLYRYLNAKYQVFPQYNEFAPADLALLSAMTKIATLMGAQLNADMFQEMRVELTSSQRTAAWKAPLAAAFKAIQERARSETWIDALHSEADAEAKAPQPTVIRIPAPQPKKKPAEKPKPDDNVAPELEIIVRQRR